MSGTLATAATADDLIDGDPGHVETDARRLRSTGRKFEAIGDRLRRVRAESWTGRAADNFETEMKTHPKHWYTAADRLSDVAGQLEDYAETLRWALSEAEEAIALYEKGARLNQAHGGVDPNGGPALSPEGTQKQDEAQIVLNNARKKLQKAGDDAGGKIEGYTHKIADYDVEYSDSDISTPRSKPFSCTGPEFASWWELTLLDCDGYDRVTHDFEHDYTLFGIPLTVAGEGHAGMQSSANASAGKDGINASADGMLGATYDVENTVSVLGHDVSITGTGHAGPGFNAEASLGQNEQGQWEFGIKGSASPLIGGGVGVDIPIPDPVVGAVNDSLDQVKDGLDQLPDQLPWP